MNLGIWVVGSSMAGEDQGEKRTRGERGGKAAQAETAQRGKVLVKTSPLTEEKSCFVCGSVDGQGFAKAPFSSGFKEPPWLGL